MIVKCIGNNRKQLENELEIVGNDGGMNGH